MPSTLDIVAIAFDIPEYIAPGVGVTTCIRVYPSVSSGRVICKQCTNLEKIDGVHDGVFLCAFVSNALCIISPEIRTAMPANAPAAMFAPSEKFDGNPSYS